MIATQGHTYEKVVSNIQEVRARGAEVIAVATYGDDDIAATRRARTVCAGDTRAARGDSRDDPHAGARVSYREAARMQRRPAAQPRQVRHGGVARDQNAENHDARPTSPGGRSGRRHRRDRPDACSARATSSDARATLLDVEELVLRCRNKPERSTTPCVSRPRRQCSRLSERASGYAFP